MGRGAERPQCGMKRGGSGLSKRALQATVQQRDYCEADRPKGDRWFESNCPHVKIPTLHGWVFLRSSVGLAPTAPRYEHIEGANERSVSPEGEPLMTRSAGNLISGEVVRNKRSAQGAVAPIENAELPAKQEATRVC